MTPREAGHQYGVEIREQTPLLSDPDSSDYNSALGFAAYLGGVQAEKLGYGDPRETEEGAGFLGGFLAALYGRD